MATKKEKEAAAKLATALAALASIVEATNDPARGSIYTATDVNGPLVAEGYVEINEAYKNEAGEVATRATAKGAQYIMDQNANSAGAPTNEAPAAPAATNGKPTFNLAANVEIPGARRRGGKGGNIYPFDNMEVGHSFFVPATADKPTPAKSLASTVSSATARYAVEVKDVDGSVTGTVGATIMESVTVPVYQTGPDGKRVKDAAGKLVKIGESTEVRPKMQTTREFTIRDVADGAPWGFPGVKGAGIWRTK